MTWVNWVYSKEADGFNNVDSFRGDTKQQPQEADQDIDLDGMIEFLRAGDYRLVRFNIESEEAENRQHEACSRDIQRVMDILMRQGQEEAGGHRSSDDKVKAVRILTMCSLQNPYFRDRIGTYEKGKVLGQIISMLDSMSNSSTSSQNRRGGGATEVAGAATAAEAIWILSFNNKFNHGYFVENGAIEKLSSIIKLLSFLVQQHDTQNISRMTSTAESNNSNSNNKERILLAAMWSAAALQNLAASYCATDTGHCWWLYDHDARPPKGGGLYLHPQSPLSIDGSMAAGRISQDEDLMIWLKDQVCKGSRSIGSNSSSSAAGDVITSLATIHDERQLSSKITTWSMAGLLKNLALYHSSKKAPMDAVNCLCVLTASQDWLEASKASDALYRLGRDPEDCFQSSHDQDL
eukprot:CAMPEP_0176505198 /NCGR_PEP_ID=MMETSP0200_2-20121128/16360_1 /TAXON_ID=947934 /ORGANISM="Chaetoceros sp., Strain GSL56" /LENGTH=406 /DNA_ID=CAMNT_0017904723 /DNA_START=249 /DNA_END=1469 /DNA_ORIENTATION=-